MQISFGSSSARLLVNAAVLCGAALFLAVGCGGGGSDGGSSKAGANASGDAGDSSTGGSSGKGGGSGGKGSSGNGNTNAGGASGEGGDTGQAGEAPVAQNHSAVAFVSGGVLAKSKNFVLISGTGESLGGNVGSKQAKSLKYTYIPGVIAASAR